MRFRFGHPFARIHANCFSKVYQRPLIVRTHLQGDWKASLDNSAVGLIEGDAGDLVLFGVNFDLVGHRWDAASREIAALDTPDAPQ